MLTVEYYQSLADNMASAVSEETLNHIQQTVDKEIDVAMCALDLYLGQSTDMSTPKGQMWLDLSKLDDADGKFIDMLPDVGSEEPEDILAREQARADNIGYEWYWHPDGKGGVKLVSFFADYAARTYLGRNASEGLKAIKALLENTSQTLPDDHPFAVYNGFKSSQLRVEKAYLTAILNKIENRSRDAVAVHQQYSRMKEFKLFGKAPGIEVAVAKGTQGDLSRTKRPFVITDSTETPLEQREFSVSSFLGFDVPRAIRANELGTAPLAALRATLKRAPQPDQGEIKISSGMSIENLEAGVSILWNWLDNNDRIKALTLRLKDAKKGKTLEHAMIMLYYDTLMPVMDSVEYQQKYAAIKAGESADVGEEPKKTAKAFTAEGNAAYVKQLIEEAKKRLAS